MSRAMRCFRSCWPFNSAASKSVSPNLGSGAAVAASSASALFKRTRYQARCRAFSCQPFLWAETAAAADKAKNLSQKFVDDHERDVARTFARQKQDKRPWHRAGSEAEPPSASIDPTNGDKTKGRLLTTPTRLLKVILPLPAHSNSSNTRNDFRNNKSQDESCKTRVEEYAEAEDIQPLALLVHPQQPLSYLERLLQAEIPPIRDGNVERVPEISFHAEADLGGENSRKKTGSQNPNATQNKEGNVSSYSGLGREGPKHSDGDANWVRWSTSTEIGDFIRDAARGREFTIAMEGYDRELRVAVPSFNDRTYYMRIRLRKMSRQIENQAKIKQECDRLAHKGVHRIAQGGFAALIGWWGGVYYVTFHTDFGWDLVEPITYLVGLTTMIGGYMWFLYISRDLSYKAALNITVSRRQQALYAARGFDLDKWEGLVQEANSLRREIKLVATEYDVDWDEMRDLGGEEVKEVLEREGRKDEKKNGRHEDEDDGDDEQEGYNRETVDEETKHQGKGGQGGA